MDDAEEAFPRGASGAGRPHSLPHPLAFVPPEGQAPYAGQWPFVHPSQSYPYYPAAHPEMHQFGFFGAGADGAPVRMVIEPARLRSPRGAEAADTDDPNP